MDKKSKENKEMPEDPVEEKTAGEGEIQEKAEEAVEEKIDEPEEETDSEEIQDTKPAGKEEAKQKSMKAEGKKEAKKEDQKKKVKHDENFRYIVRIANTDIDGEKKLVYGLTTIRGIGHHMGVLVAQETGIDRNTKFGDLTDAQIEKIQKTLDNILEKAPSWMLNHRKDYETGEDIHLIGSEIDMRLRDEINIMKKIRSYRGIRHERGLPVRGQRTRANNRKGLALGVSKKREPTTTTTPSSSKT